MRLNKYLAENSSLSRRKADIAIENGRVYVNNNLAKVGQTITESDNIKLDGVILAHKPNGKVTLLLNKPVGYVCSRDGQGSPTVYDLIPKKYHQLNIAGRLDKDSSGLVVMTNDGDLLHELTHPSKHKEKVYEVTLDRELDKNELDELKSGVDIGDDRPSKFKDIARIGPKKYKITLEEGRNRQIRRTLGTLKTAIIKLHRTSLHKYTVGRLKSSLYVLMK